jgi:hypothetical protein
MVQTISFEASSIITVLLPFVFRDGEAFLTFVKWKVDPYG